MILVPAIGIYLGSYFVDNPYAWIVLRFFVGVANMAATTVKSVYAVSSKFNFTNYDVANKYTIIQKQRNLAIYGQGILKERLNYSL